MKIIRITSRKEDADAFNRDIEQNSNNGKCFILHFFMKGCIHCENLEPKMRNLEKHMMSHPKYDNVTLGKIDADMMDSVNVENAYEFPTLKVVKNGEIHQYKGAPDESAILTWIDSLVKNSAPTQRVHLSNHNSLGRKSLKISTNRGIASGVSRKKYKRKSRKHKTRKMRKTKKRENKSNKKNKRGTRTKRRTSKKH
jgi:hypothetical protein